MKEQYFEVLAPAGGPEPLRAAVYAGADAVYLGGPAFGARANAQNFSREQLAEAVRFCHARGVRVHVTVNTLLKEKELPQALELVEYLCTLPVDAVLVQDMGLFSLLRQWGALSPGRCACPFRGSACSAPSWAAAAATGACAPSPAACPLPRRGAPATTSL